MVHNTSRFLGVLCTAFVTTSLILAGEAKPSVVRTFPAAEGHGAQSVGGRGGRVIEVTNLNDSGPGSLRAALEAEGPRIVVFRVAGIIRLEDKIRINSAGSYLTVAGQTAPGGGIIVKGSKSSLLGIHDGAHDLVLRYLRLRNGSGVADGHGNDNLTISGGYNIIVDHVSMSWSTDENVGIYKKTHHTPIHKITIQRSIMAEGLAGHSNGMLISGEWDDSDPNNPIDNWRQVYDLSIHHNLFVHNTHRNPRVTSGGAQIINNVTYNWKSRIGSTTRGSISDFINNYFKAGPMSNLRRLLLHENFSLRRLFKPYADPSIYTVGNIVEPVYLDPTADNWRIHKLNYLFTSVPKHYHRHTPLPRAPIPITQQPAYAAYASVLRDVGANARLDCLGNWVPTADAVDRRILSDVRNNTGPTQPVNRPDAVGGYPEVDPGVPCDDNDHDGMPDEWEILHGFNPNEPSDGPADADADRYTNVEEYLNGTDPA